MADVAHRAVDIDVAGRNLPVAADPLRVELHGIAVFAEKHLRRSDTHRESETDMMDEVPVFTVDRHEALRLRHRHQGAQLSLPGVATDVDGFSAGVDHLGPASVELVDHAPDRPLVARDRVGTDDHHVSRADP